CLAQAAPVEPLGDQTAMDAHAPSLRMADPLTANARDLEADLAWLAEVIDARLASYLRREIGTRDPLSIPPPDLAGSGSPYARFVRDFDLPVPLRLTVLLALAPHVRPEMLDVLYTRNDATARGFTEFGGVAGTQHGGFLPTGQTAAFLLAGDSLALRFQTMRLFDGDHVLTERHVLRLGPVGTGEPPLSGVLALSPEW